MPLIDGPTVHAVTDADVLVSPGFLTQATAVLQALGPRVAVHIRGPGLPGRLVCEIADALSRVQADTGGWLVINDRADIAATVGARGLQLPSHGLAVSEARSVSPHSAIGVSVHSGDAARAAATAGADWLIAGNLYATTSHPGRPAGGQNLTKSVVTAGLPTIMIGGILPHHVPGLRELGVHGVATISGIWLAPDPVDAALAYSGAFERPC